MTFTLKDNIIDTRSILDRIKEIESENTDEEGELRVLRAWSEDDQKEWRELTEIIDEIGEDAARDGTMLIHEDYFPRHVRDEFLEIGPELYEYRSKSGRASWDMEYAMIQREELLRRQPFFSIDWQKVADDAWSDYSQLEVDGVTYLYEGR
jgi:hypothetical protein